MLYLFIFLSSIFAKNIQREETVDLTILITNIKTFEGIIETGIFNDPKVFLEKDKAFKTISQKVTNDTMVIKLSGLVKGYYAISTYHDVNADKVCNLNLIGRPVEPFGFSNNYHPRLFKPSFDDCKISVFKNSTTSIKLLH